MGNEVMELLRMAFPVVIGLAASYLFAKFADPLKRLKDLSKSPVVSILAAAAVMLAEAYWSDYEGKVQFEKACEWLAHWLDAPAVEVEQLVKGAYEALKSILGDEWGSLKLGLEGLDS